MSKMDRRDFLKTSVLGGLAASAGLYASSAPVFAGTGPLMGKPLNTASKVALSTGADRADVAFKALQPFAKEIAQAVGKKKIILKPNNVSTKIQLSATYAETLEGTLEFFKSIKKLDQVVVAESAADGPAVGGFENYGYMKVFDKYKVKWYDLDELPSEIHYIVSEKDMKPRAVRFSSLLMDPDSYLVSVARMKTHDRVFGTLSLKNIVFGAPVKDYGNPRQQRPTNYKPILHGDGFKGINYNLFTMAKKLHPHLALIDGFTGMEGNGPTQGTPVDHRVCVASTDWLAADRVGYELMGIDYSIVAYLNYCAESGMGQGDLSKIEVIGERIADHKKKYKLHERSQQMLLG